jgi:hypothetical protein
MFRTPNATILLAAALLSGCATQPMGPTARVMPASGKSFEVFAQDQVTCKQFADGEVNGGATMANLKEFGTAAITTGLGGGLGAAIRGERGAEVGGSLGAIGGAAIAGHGSARDQNNLQGRYDLAYTQCMYARGNQVGGSQAGGNRAGTAAAANTVPGAALGAPVGSPRSLTGQPVGVP